MGREVEGPAVSLSLNTPLRKRFVIPSEAEESHSLHQQPTSAKVKSLPLVIPSEAEESYLLVRPLRSTSVAALPFNPEPQARDLHLIGRRNKCLRQETSLSSKTRSKLSSTYAAQ